MNTCYTCMNFRGQQLLELSTIHVIHANYGSKYNPKYTTISSVSTLHSSCVTCTDVCDCFPNLSTVSCYGPELWCCLALCCLWIAGFQQGGANLIRTLGQWSAAHKTPPDQAFALSVSSCIASWWIIIHFCTYNFPFVGCYCWVLMLNLAACLPFWLWSSRVGYNKVGSL